MPGPYVAPVPSDQSLPARVDVAVVGAGIVGAASALELAERGHSVALCEKGQVALEQSSRNWGWVRLSRRDPRELPLMMEAARIWEGLDTRLGRPTGYRKSGIVFTYDRSEERKYDWYHDVLQRHQIATRMMTSRDVKEMYPDLALPMQGALYTPDDGRAEPQLAGPAIAAAARDKGAHILTDCAVRGLETTAGRVSAVITERGVIACDAVVLAGGVWSNFFARRYGIDIPQLNVMNSVLRTAPLAGGPEEALWATAFALRKRQDGGYTIASGHENVVDIVPRSFRYFSRYLPALKDDWRSLNFRLSTRFLRDLQDARMRPLDQTSAFERTRTLDPEPSQRLTDGALKALTKAWPVFREAQIKQRWAGYIDVTPDALPVICETDKIPGFFISTGFSGHGFGIAPGAGRLVADLVSGGRPCVDPVPFRLSRFFDGSKLELMPPS